MLHTVFAGLNRHLPENPNNQERMDVSLMQHPGPAPPSKPMRLEPGRRSSTPLFCVDQGLALAGQVVQAAQVIAEDAQTGI